VLNVTRGITLWRRYPELEALADESAP